MTGWQQNHFSNQTGGKNNNINYQDMKQKALRHFIKEVQRSGTNISIFRIISHY